MCPSIDKKEKKTLCEQAKSVVNLKIACLSQQGVSRSINQDNIRIRNIAKERYAVLCLCDGIGGLDDGEVASAIVVEMVAKRILNSPAEKLISRAIRANGVLSKRFKKCGTTLSAVVIDKCSSEYCILNIGDSRVYLLRGGEVVRLTEDDVVRQPYNAERTLLTRAIGVRESLGNLNVRNGTLENGATLFLMSDGAYSKITNNDFQVIDYSKRPEEYIVSLLDQAVLRRSLDDISIVVCKAL